MSQTDNINDQQSKKLRSPIKWTASAAILTICLVMSTGCANSNDNQTKESSNATATNQVDSNKNNADADGTENTGNKDPVGTTNNNSQKEATPDPSLEENPPIVGNPYEVAGVTDVEGFIAMFNAVKAAADTDDKEKLAEYVLYPMAVNGENPLKIENKEQFIEQYDHIFTTYVKESLAAQQAADLFVNYKGIMVGDGAIWFGVVVDKDNGEKQGIIAINP